MSKDYLEKLLRAKNTRDVCPDTVRRVWEECSRKYKKPKDAEKAAREALHGITGAFLTPSERARLTVLLDVWDGGDEGLSEILAQHASTRERLPLPAMDALYRRIFEITGPPRSILDLACGLNPVYLASRAPEGCEVVGVDISNACVTLINDALNADRTHAMCADLLCPNASPPERFDVALLFKVLPLLERQRAGAAMEVMNAVNARHIVVSFPTRTLGGRNVGMAAHYTEWMASHMPPKRTDVGRFETENELFFVLEELDQ